MKLSEELKKIDQYIGIDTDKFNEYYVYLVAKYPSEKTQIDDYIESSLLSLTTEIGKVVDEIGIKVQLMKVSEILSMSYIAKNYFHRTRQWLYKKVNGNLVNGKPAKFTDSEIKTLNFAIQDISKQLGSLNISL
ncbi:MAG: DUF5053 domain-containing protein [Dysgonamonadaceae bacterium]|jgi:hypothetical protein|nr:DUF5053 domain-containing protein [Dysgonamonadaceae bacterium]